MAPPELGRYRSNSLNWSGPREITRKFGPLINLHYINALFIQFDLMFVSD